MKRFCVRFRLHKKYFDTIFMIIYLYLYPPWFVFQGNDIVWSAES